MDIYSTEQRRRLMRRVKNKDTKPEMSIRRALHSLGFRYRLHVSTMPGRPDIVLPRYRAVIQVHGCFWHGHDCERFTLPRTREAFWQRKIEGNRDRDERNTAALNKHGWRQLTIWECALRGRGRLGLQKTVARTAWWLRHGTDNECVRSHDAELPEVLDPTGRTCNNITKKQHDEASR